MHKAPTFAHTDSSITDAECTYELVQTGPSMTAEETETAAASLEVSVRWGSSVLAIAHLTPPRSFFVGDGADVDCVIPTDVLGARRAPIVLADENGFASIVVAEGMTGRLEIAGERAMTLSEALAAGRGLPCDELAGAQRIALPPGAKARLEIAGITFAISAGNAAKNVAGRFHMSTDALPFHGVSALVHLGLLASVALFTPALASAAEGERDPAQDYAMQQYMAAAAEREPEARENADVADAAVQESQGQQGTAAKGSSGSMGDPAMRTRGGRWGVEGPKDNTNPVIGKQQMLEEAGGFGVIALLSSPTMRYTGPTAPWGSDDPLGNDALSARGNMWGDTVADAAGAGGLGLSGIGEGGDGPGEGIGLGHIGTIGHCGAGLRCGDGVAGFGKSRGLDRGAHKPTSPTVRATLASVNGRIPPDVIQRIVRQNFGRFRGCYEGALRNNPSLQGRVGVNFVIGRDGSVSSAQSAGSDLPDAGVVSCVVKSFYGLSFPKPDGGIVTVSYPIVFTPAQ